MISGHASLRLAYGYLSVVRDTGDGGVVGNKIFSFSLFCLLD